MSFQPIDGDPPSGYQVRSPEQIVAGTGLWYLVANCHESPVAPDQQEVVEPVLQENDLFAEGGEFDYTPSG